MTATFTNNFIRGENNISSQSFIYEKTFFSIMFDQNKKINHFDILFLLLIISFLFFLTAQYSSFKGFFGFSGLVFFAACLFLLTFFGGVIYGFLSKIKFRAALLGFLFPFLFGFADFVYSVAYYSFIHNDPSLLTLKDSSLDIFEFGIFIFIGILCGISGFFAANQEENRKKRYLLYFISFIFTSLAFLLFFNMPYSVYFAIVGY